MAMGKKTSSREKIFENQKTGNPVIDLNKFAKPLGLTGIKSMGVILGAGPEGLTRKSYSMPISGITQKSKKDRLAANYAKMTGLDFKTATKHLNSKTLKVSLPTKALDPITSGDLEAAKRDRNLAETQKVRNVISNEIKNGLSRFAQTLQKRILGEHSGGVKDVTKHVGAGALGDLYEASLRAALGGNKVDNEQAAFDFLGKDARILSNFMVGNDSLSAIEMKYTSAAATNIPKKVINQIYQGFANGYIPNFANPLSDAIGRERDAGVPAQIRVGTHPALMNKGNPIGLGVTNTRDEPNGLKDVFGAKGYVPNYALNFLSDFGAGRDEYKSAAELQKELNVENKKLLKEQKELNQLKKSGKDVTKRLQGVEKQLTRNLQDQAFASKMAAESTKKMGLVARAGGLTQKAINANQAFSNSAVGRGLSGFGGMG